MDYKTLTDGYQTIITKLLLGGWRRDEVIEAYKTCEINYLSALVGLNGYGERVFSNPHDAAEEVLAHQRANSVMGTMSQLIFGTVEATKLADEIMNLPQPKYLNGIPYDSHKVNDISLANVRVLLEHGVSLSPGIVQNAIMLEALKLSKNITPKAEVDDDIPIVTFDEGKFTIH